jgi:kumamolisin
MSEKRVKAIAGSFKAPEKRSRVIGDIDPEHQKSITIVLRPKVAFDLAAHRAAGAAPLSREEFEQRYGADPQAVRRVEEFASRHHLSVVSSDLAQRTVIVRGRTADILDAFSIPSLKLYATHDNQIFTGREGEIFIPEELEPVIEAVFGIDDRPAARPHFRRMSRVLEEHLYEPRLRIMLKQAAAPAAQPRAFSAPEIAALYDFPANLKGDGQCIGIIELGGGFAQSDLDAYFGSLGLPTPKVTAISVNGGSNKRGDPADGEVQLDIEVAGAVAPHASQAVYFAKNRDSAFIGAVKAAVHDNIRKPSIISISWGKPEDGWTPMARHSFDTTLQEAAALGVTVLVASGDNGAADDDTPTGEPHVDYPAASPFVLACGGTKLLASGPTTIAAETVWNEGPGGGAGGGGVSNVEPKPSYQNGANVPLSPIQFAGRGVPDVSGDADPRTGYKVFIDGAAEVIGGTSAVAPLYAGLVALINQARAIGGLPPAGFINDDLYAAISTCRDITSGDNDMFGNLGVYSAGAGWDAASGLGVADGTKWLQALLPVPAASKKPAVQPLQPQV